MMPLIKVVSYNIKNGEGMDGKIDLSRDAEILAGLDADIVCLQEVDMYRPRSYFSNQAGRLARVLKMNYVYGAASVYRIGSFGNAVLSRYPARKSVNHRLPAPHSQRTMQEVHYIIEGRLLRLFNTHMELNRRLRLLQIQDYIVPLIMSENSAAVLCGDLNETPAGEGITYLSQYLSDSFAVNSGILTATFRADDPRERIDYIMLNQAGTATDYKIVASLASDHLPVMAWIEV